MANSKRFVYMDEASIDDEFKCSICNEPFDKPTCTPCDHTFCRLCIEEWLTKSSSRHRPCPTCREPISVANDLTPASRLISNRIDRYPVKCLSCGLEDIQRGLFLDHLSKACTKSDMTCSASDIWCVWSGPREQFEDHFKSCPYQQIRPALEAIRAMHDRLEHQYIEQQQQIAILDERCQIQEAQIEQLKAAINHSKRTLASTNDNVSIQRTLTFDELGEEKNNQNSYFSIPSTYANFKWHNGAFMPRQHGKKTFPNTGFATAFEQNQTCTAVGFNFGCQPLVMRDERKLFWILSFEATCAFQDQVILTVIGRRAKQTVQSVVFTLRAHHLNIYKLNWKDIDELEFVPTGGKQLSNSTDTDKHVVLTALHFG